MFSDPKPIEPRLTTPFLRAAEAAARAVPPAFPLDATVAVNPFLGQAHENLETASARLARVAGLSLTRPRAELVAEIDAGMITDEDLAAALIASTSPVKPCDLALLKSKMRCATAQAGALPSVADLAATATGTDWPAVMARAFGLWAAGYFDRGQALWTPRSNAGAYAAWREWATHDLTPEIAGLAGFCSFVAAAPDTAERAIARASDRLNLRAEAAETAYHRLLAGLGGWAMHARWLLWQAEQAGGHDATLTDLLAICLIWEQALLAQFPQLEPKWCAIVDAHAAPVQPSADQALDAILQDACERAHQRALAGLLTGPVADSALPVLQAAFCIDVRSEVFRRALEAQNDGIETLGFAGFFGLPLAHRAAGTDALEPRLPVLLNPTLVSCSHESAAQEQRTRVKARAKRAWGRFRQAAVSSFSFVEAAGPSYVASLLRDALGFGAQPPFTGPTPRIEAALTPEQKAQTATAVLRAMGLTQNYARLVLLVGHGARMTNNPHESAYHCGACGGQTGEVSARVLASLLNDPDTRAGLRAGGMAIPDDTLFVGGLHDTVTDRVTLFRDTVSVGHAADLAAAERWLAAATQRARAERATRLPGASGADLPRRAHDWAEVRPEWGLAGCSAFIAAPRRATKGRDLQGRAFLHSYDWRSDQGFATLELILTAPVVVASWISLQYYASAIAPRLFGGGNKLIHNVVGGIGVLEGNGGLMRAGLPIQALNDGQSPAHQPLRLSVMIDAPVEAMTPILRKHPHLRDLFDNGWLHLFALQDGVVVARYRGGLRWESGPTLPATGVAA